MGACVRESELRVDYPNGGQVRLYGADNPDALRGIYLDGVVLDATRDAPLLLGARHQLAVIGADDGGLERALVPQFESFSFSRRSARFASSS